MRFVAGRGAMAKRMAALWQRAVGKMLLAGAPWRRCWQEHHQEDAAGKTAVAKHHREETDGRSGTVAESHREETAGRPTERRAKSRTANSSIGYIKSMLYLC